MEIIIRNGCPFPSSFVVFGAANLKMRRLKKSNSLGGSRFQTWSLGMGTTLVLTLAFNVQFVDTRCGLSLEE
jgi:hypothetical protein